MHNLKTYIEEAISSRRNTLNNLFTSETDMDVFCRNLEHCGIQWNPKIGKNTRLTIGVIKDAVMYWEDGYDTTGIGESTSLVISTENRFYIFDWDWDKRYKTGPESAEYYGVKGGNVIKMTDDLEKALEELNKELGDRYKENGYLKR
jgi:hypothetical protein